MVLIREKTRRERYDLKKADVKSLPVSIACINFMHDGNLAYLIRAAACFGATDIHVIGAVQTRSELNSLSGSLYDYVKIIQHNTPNSFLVYSKSIGAKIISAELTDSSRPITSYDFDFSVHTIMVVGNEETGVPVEILSHSDNIYIPMPGVGYCLNTSQAANILLYEAVRQYERM